MDDELHTMIESGSSRTLVAWHEVARRCIETAGEMQAAEYVLIGVGSLMPGQLQAYVLIDDEVMTITTKYPFKKCNYQFRTLTYFQPMPAEVRRWLLDGSVPPEKGGTPLV